MSIEIEPVMKSRGIVARALFPSHMTRFAIAAALTFFPDVLMYPLEYPAPELIALSAWIWAFPSRLGFAAFVLAPFIPNPTYGYWAFNLFCVQASLSIAKAATSSSTWAGEDLGKAHKPLRLYMFVTLGICFLQVITDPGPWVALFPHMRLEPGRGAGLRLEPSQIGSLLGIYLLMLVGALTRVRTSAGAIKNTTAYVREGAAMIVATVVLTRSLTVLIVACCFLPGLFQVRRKQIALAASVGIVCLGITYMVFGDRLQEAVATSGGDPIEFVTSSLSSWRNTPDLLIVTDASDFMLPGNPSEVRLRLHDSAVLLSPLLGWIQNTFTLFSAGGVTLGLPGTLAVMAATLIGGLSRLRRAGDLKLVWMLVYVAGWLIFAKWDSAMWLAIGVLPLIHRVCTSADLQTSLSASDSTHQVTALPSEA